MLAACAHAPPAVTVEPPSQPEAGTGLSNKPGWAVRTWAVAAANPLAADAGFQMLRAGGSAVDAAIAVQMVLTLVEPQSSGIGGGAFLLHFDGHRVEAFDGRETAPAAVDDRLFIGADGKALPFYEAVVGGRAVGVPGTVRMLEMAHRQHGKLPWSRLFQPAIRLAEQGFPVSPRLHTLLAGDTHLKKDPVAAGYFYQPDGRPHRVGHELRNPALAAVLRRLAIEGARALHEGDIAQAIVEKVRSHPDNPGRMTLADLAGYQPRQRSALCHDWRASGKDWHVCGFPPPSSGAIAVAQILGILSLRPAASLPLRDGLPSADWLHEYTESARLAFADRAQYVADPDFVQPPGGSWASLLEPDYLAQRAALIASRSMRVAQPGVPGALRPAQGAMGEQLEYGTSHISIVDRWGNALAMTASIEDQFGSRQMVRGFLLNNQLTDFSFVPADALGRPIANRVQPGKRPRSSMAPTLVFDRADGRLVLTVGSPGGAQIIHYVAKTLQGVFGWGLDAQQAITLPNFGSNNGPTVLEEGRFPSHAIQSLRARGAEVREQAMTSGLQAIMRTPDGWFGGADPRREGVVMGE
ncbi:gamma-glutamyltransferase family protein [Ramlibacter sp. AW1]|uniref:Gamma-glutamyltransferase family protein n=1 Tax=Ramlibacter aurantiacus TaxID=2801330 RepID=A0A936ZPY1_9BURK|nr:gamma-glutamyltransferase family protein [Ramlibacter aurantiacus]MBL0420326.1 gamma-glutamyltransferase family protein [Ramlibacter aurantiacus]